MPDIPTEQWADARHQLITVTVFGLGPRTDKAEAWHRSQTRLDRALAKHPWLTTTSVALLGGVDPPGKAALRDLCEWAAVTTWAARLTPHVPRPIH